MENWHWYDTVLFVSAWSLPVLLVLISGYMEQRWERAEREDYLRELSEACKQLTRAPGREGCQKK